MVGLRAKTLLNTLASMSCEPVDLRSLRGVFWPIAIVLNLPRICPLQFYQAKWCDNAHRPQPVLKEDPKVSGLTRGDTPTIIITGITLATGNMNRILTMDCHRRSCANECARDRAQGEREHRVPRWARPARPGFIRPLPERTIHRYRAGEPSIQVRADFFAKLVALLVECFPSLLSDPGIMISWTGGTRILCHPSSYEH